MPLLFFRIASHIFLTCLFFPSCIVISSLEIFFSSSIRHCQDAYAFSSHPQTRHMNLVYYKIDQTSENCIISLQNNRQSKHMYLPESIFIMKKSGNLSWIMNIQKSIYYLRPFQHIGFLPCCQEKIPSAAAWSQNTAPVHSCIRITATEQNSWTETVSRKRPCTITDLLKM